MLAPGTSGARTPQDHKRQDFVSNSYEAPLTLMMLNIEQAARITGARDLEGYQEVLTDLAAPTLETASRFAGDVLSPLNGVGDRSPARCGAQGIVATPGFTG